MLIMLVCTREITHALSPLNMLSKVLSDFTANDDVPMPQAIYAPARVRKSLHQPYGVHSSKHCNFAAALCA
jgi:hypothetical protein